MFGDSKSGSFGGGNLDPRMALGIVFVAVIAILSIMADRAVFVRAPNNFVERLLALPPTFGYWLFNDRVGAAIVSILFFTTISAAMGFVGWRLLEVHVIEPMHIKRAIERSEREESLKNKYTKRHD